MTTKPQQRRLLLWICVLCAVWGCLLVVSCKEELPVYVETVDRRAPAPPPVRDAGPPPLSPPTQAPSTRRIVAFGDVHGDLEATRRVLRLIGAIDAWDRWIGGTLRVVQTGDQLDRGDKERAILDMFLRLQDEAKAAGGAFVVLNGNHEVMNVQWDFRYVTEGGWLDFHNVPGLTGMDAPELAQFSADQRPRAVAFRPGGPYAKLLAQWPITFVLEGTLFVHGGVLPKHVEYGLQKINEETQAWMLGHRELPAPMQDGDSPVWSRHFSNNDDDPKMCDLLAETLQKAKVTRMVVGHTPYTSGITSACNQQVWRIDTGMAKPYKGVIQALEINGAQVKILKASE